jgi:hypothetical protein
MRRLVSCFFFFFPLISVGAVPESRAQDAVQGITDSTPVAVTPDSCQQPDGNPQDDACKPSKKQAVAAELPVKNRLVVVGKPKVYDDLYLRQQLAALQSQLAGIHAVDQATLLSHIGMAQGASLNQISAAISASGLPTPQVQTFALPPGVPAFSYPPGYGPPSPVASVYPTYPTGVATTTTPGTQTTLSSVTPTAPAPAPLTLAPPSISSLSQSSLDTYNESLQLSAEITNTTLLLQGALSDTLSHDGNPKTTVTVGFPITVEAPAIADKDLAGAVAEVRVGICSVGTNESAEYPSIVTLLPRERTYNVASLVEKSFLASASTVMGGVLNVGGGFLWSHKRYYLVQQQETVAFLSPEENKACDKAKNRTSFTWQIRPVLGKEFIRPGNSVNFVQFAIPEVIAGATTTTTIGRTCVSVVWRKPAVTGLFRKKSDEYLGDSITSNEQCYDIDYYNTLSSKNRTLTVTDVGQGLVTVKAVGTFLPGTTVRLGSTYLPPDSIDYTHDMLKFTTSASAIVAAGHVYFVGRDLREIEALRPYCKKDRLTINDVSISPYSDTQSLVIITFQAPPRAEIQGRHNPADDPWVVVIGGKVFGLSDAPFLAQTEIQIQAIVPTALIQGSPRVELRRLLWSDNCYRGWKDIPPNTFSKASPSVVNASILSTQKGLTIGLVGTGLDQVTMVFPAAADCPGCQLDPVGSTFLRITLPKPKEPKKDEGKKDKKKDEKNEKNADDKPAAIDPTDGLRQLVLCRRNASELCDGNFPTLLVDVPKLDASAPKPSLDKHDPIPMNTAQVTITGSLLDQVVSIEHAKGSLTFRLVPGKKPSLVVDLPASMSTIPGGYSLLVTFADKTATAYLLTIEKKGL